MRVAIIGGCGFVGHHLAQKLENALCIDNLGVNNLYAPDFPERYEDFCEERLNLLENIQITDARDYDTLSHTLKHYNPDVIIHLAALAHIDRSRKDPHATFEHSLRTLENSLDAAVALNARLVYFSSSTVYGDFSKPIIDETEPLKPKGTYGKLKQAGELMVTAYHDDWKLPYLIIRPQALYGPRCVSRRVTQVFIENAMHELPIMIHGDGSSKHDFTHVNDVVTGTIQALEAEATGIFNLTNGNATSLDELANIVTDRFPTEIVYTEEDDEKPSRGTMTCEKARLAFGFVPKYDIYSGMNNVMDWYERRSGH